MTWLQQWVRRPQEHRLRRALFHIHVWTGVGVGLYVFVIGLTGSVLVYRNELYRFFAPQPMIVSGTGSPLSIADLTRAIGRAYPDHAITEVTKGSTDRHAVDVILSHGDERIRRLIHPYTGEDLGNPVPAGFRVTTWLLDLHDNLLAGETGRRVNGAGAVFLTVLCMTGAIIWWPGAAQWRRSLTIGYRANWKRLTWRLHSALGFWFFAFLLLWSITGMYLSFPQAFGAVFDRLEPFDDANPVERTVDRIQYWLAYLHFGRLGGRGIPGCGRGVCDAATKGLWAVSGLVPPVMFVTGAIMWWNRVVGPAVRRAARVRRDSEGSTRVGGDPGTPARRGTPRSDDGRGA